MNPRFHNTAMKMGVGGLPAAPPGLGPGGDSTQGSAPPPSTLGHIPAAASRLKVFAVQPCINAMHHTLEGCFRKGPGSVKATPKSPKCG